MPSGYVRVWAPGHPAANADGYVLEHRKVLIDAGYDLDPSQHVHHVNGNKTDNRLENLQVKTAADHAGDHIRERGYIENQHGVHELRGVRVCAGCGESFVPWTAKSKFCSRACANRRRRPAPTHCKRGHEFTAENTRVDAGGWRQCRACDAIRRL